MADISSYREQILSNAIYMFPKVFSGRGNFPSTKEHGVFDVILFSEVHREETYYTAALLCGNPDDRKIAAEGAAGKSPEQALKHLMWLTAASLGVQGGMFIMEEKKAVPHGLVDASLL